MSVKLEDILSQVKEVEEKSLKEESQSALDPRILQLKKGVTYHGRLVPRIVDDSAKSTFVTYEECGFTSHSDGTYVYLGRSPKNGGVPSKSDLINKTQWDAYTKAKERGDEAAMKETYKLIPRRKQAVNYYLHGVDGDDEAAKAKIGTTTVLRYPAQLNKQKEPTSEIYKKIYAGLFGEKVGKIGAKAIDLSAKGRSLVIKVGTKGEWASYEAEFDDAEDLGLTAAQIKDILASAHDLTEFVPAVKSEQELKQILDEHWFVKNAAAQDEVDTSDDSSGGDEIDNVLKDLNPDEEDDNKLNF